MSNTPRSNAAYDPTRPEAMHAASCQIERKLNEANEKLKQAHRDFGYELRDPAGTIWDECKRLQEELKEARKDAARLDHLLNGRLLFTYRDDIDKEMEAER